MRRHTVERESEKWVEKSIITEAQREEIVALYPEDARQNIFALFAVIFISIGILIFALSDVSFMSTMIKVVLLLAVSTVFYLVGSNFYAREQKQAMKWKSYYGISFILIAYFFFGATLLVVIQDYHIQLFSAWPFMIWSFIGIILCYLFENKYMYAFSIIITLLSQVFSALSFSSFSYLLLLLFILGYVPIVSRKETKSFSYYFSIGLSLQFILLSIHEIENYYWMFVFILLMYLFAHVITEQVFAKALTTVSIWTVLLYRMFESFYVQESYVFDEMTMQASFFISLAILLLASIALHWRQNRLAIMDLILFLPVFILPFPYVWVIVVLFVYAVSSLLVGYRDGMDERMKLGIVGFVIATLTLYTQYAWESINRSLFFIIGGMILFGLSILLDRVRKKQLDKGEDQS
ncbi:MAG TPA: DUF2157 domain-containing protein [Pseudogracilibacillus sp.]|nr:DUF2157 domain-containing protein [Pseudogracilibacillus sp.]